jgi:hypothetical protein
MRFGLVLTAYDVQERQLNFRLLQHLASDIAPDWHPVRFLALRATQSLLYRP